VLKKLRNKGRLFGEDGCDARLENRILPDLRRTQSSMFHQGCWDNCTTSASPFPFPNTVDESSMAMRMEKHAQISQTLRQLLPKDG